MEKIVGTILTDLDHYDNKKSQKGIKSSVSN
jgi:hypothetical protein